MKTVVETTPEKLNSDTVDELKNENAKLAHELEIAQTKLKWYEEQFRLNAARRFGKSSETVTDDQLSFFNEAEITARPQQEEPVLETITYNRKKKRGLNKANFSDLPVERIVYQLTDDEQICEVCQFPLHEMSEEIRKELKVIPAQVIVVEHVRKVYACRHCEQNADKTPIITAPMPAPVIPGSFASPSLIAYLMYQKYAAALPLTRQERIFDDFGIELSKQNMANWIIKTSELWLEPLYEAMKCYLMAETFIMADETPMQVLTKNGEPCDSKAYMWLYRSGKHGKAIVLYEYQPSRAGRHAMEFLRDFSGFLQTDDFGGYNKVKNVTRVGCLAHARRYYTDALKALPKEAEIESTHAHEALLFFRQMFRLEKQWTEDELTPEKRYEKRILELQPVMEAYLSWLETTERQVLPKSKLGAAIAYSLSNWELLTNILKDGQCELSSNLAEQAIKHFVVGRKNFLFCKTPHGAKASATIYSIVVTARLNGLNPFNYLKYLLEQLPNTPITSDKSLDHLLPWSETLPEECRSTIKKD